MSKRAAPNPQIGTVACPVIGCSETCAVRRFAMRAQSDGARRQAGKLYFDCAVHGRFGFDGKEGMQDYILENADIWGSEPKGDGDERPSEPQASAPEPPTPAPTRAPPAAPKPAPPGAPAAPPSAQKPQKKRFNLWD